MFGCRSVERPPDYVGVFPFDHVCNCSTEDIQQSLDVQVVGGLEGQIHTHTFIAMGSHKMLLCQQELI